jgi:hypothetical protein
VLAEIRDAKLGGVGLAGERKQRYNEVQQELSKLSTAFSNNVLDSTKSFSKVLTDKQHVQGLPASALALAAQTAAAKGHEGATAELGPWVFTLVRHRAPRAAPPAPPTWAGDNASLEKQTLHGGAHFLKDNVSYTWLVVQHVEQLRFLAS